MKYKLSADISMLGHDSTELQASFQETIKRAIGEDTYIMIGLGTIETSKPLTEEQIGVIKQETMEMLKEKLTYPPKVISIEKVG